MDIIDLPSLITNTECSTTDSIAAPEIKPCESLVENVRPVIHSNFISHTVVRNGKTYIDLEFLLRNEIFATQQAMLLLMAQQQVTRHVETSTPNRSTRASPEFRNHREIETIFQFVVSALGVASARPRDIVMMMPPEYNLEVSTTAQMLERYRIQLLKDYSLQNIGQIKNCHCSKNACKLVRDVCEKWENPNFSGLSREQIYEALAEQ